MPEHARCDRSPGTPRVRDTAKAIRTRDGTHPLDLADRGGEREIAHRPDVAPAERHQEIDVSGPRADTPQLDQLRACAVVIQIDEAVWIKLARDDRLRQPTHIRRLLPRESGALQRRVVETRDPLGAHASSDLLQPCVGSASGCE
jgi:hypothetical protein